MKGIHFVILTIFALSLVCCTSHEDELIEVPPTPTDPIIEEPEPEDTLVIDESLCTVTMPKIQFEGEDEFATRSAIAFDYLANPKVMKFSWDFANDKIGVFPIIKNEETNQYEETDQQSYIIYEMPTTSTNTSEAIGTFGIKDNGISQKFNGKYASYFPYKTELYQFHHDAIPVSYLGQVQEENVNIYEYYQIKADPNRSKITYLNSEIRANSHLSAYDYLVSEATSTATGTLHFKYSRMGSVVRFFITVPDKKLTYDELQLINNEVNFMKTGTMSILDKTFTTSTEGHAMSLKFGEYDSEHDSYTGFDFANPSNSSYYRDSARGYIIAYMFLAPIDLRNVDYCYLYLLGRDEHGNRKYFKSSSQLTKTNLQANYFFQWAPTTTSDEPITFVPTTVQEWEEGSGYTNQDGAGTQRW